MKTLWIMFLIGAVIVGIMFFGQDTIKEQTGSDDPDSETQKFVKEAVGMNRIQYVDRAKSVGTQQEFVTIKTCFMMYYIKWGKYPKSLQEMVDDGADPGILSGFYGHDYSSKIEGTDLVIVGPGKDRIKNTDDDFVERISPSKLRRYDRPGKTLQEFIEYS